MTIPYLKEYNQSLITERKRVSNFWSVGTFVKLNNEFELEGYEDIQDEDPEGYAALVDAYEESKTGTIVDVAVVGEADVPEHNFYIVNFDGVHVDHIDGRNLEVVGKPIFPTKTKLKLTDFINATIIKISTDKNSLTESNTISITTSTGDIFISGNYGEGISIDID